MRDDMATALLDAPRTVRRDPTLDHMEQLIGRLGDIPAERVKKWPPPGTATMQDLEDYNESDRTRPVCELVDNTLVEKAMGHSESDAAAILVGEMRDWNNRAKLGKVIGPDGVVKLTKTQGRAPDTTLYLFSPFPDGKRPPGKIPLMYPDFVAEILSESNTKAEMRRKRLEYFAAGTRLVWDFDLDGKTVVVYLDPLQGKTFGIGDVLDGEDVMPGFQLDLKSFLDEVWQEAE
jgi:Uma2 family endonuclease